MHQINITLHGGDGSLETQLSQIMQNLPEQKSIAYAAIALEQIKDLEKIETAFKTIINPTLQITKPTRSTLITSANLNEIYTHNILIISGGDTSHLMQVFRDYRVAETLKTKPHSIKRIIGISAGAIALCKQGISRKNNQDIIIEGMGLISATMLPHAESLPQRIEQFKHLPNIIALGQNTHEQTIML